MLHLTGITVEHQDELRELARRLERADPDVFYGDGEDGYSGFIKAVQRAAGCPISKFDCQTAVIARAHGASVAARKTGGYSWDQAKGQRTAWKIEASSRYASATVARGGASRPIDRITKAKHGGMWGRVCPPVCGSRIGAMPARL